jgi:hypothetical protein
MLTQSNFIKVSTIGIIVLQGKAQQDIIHNLLLEKVNSKDYSFNRTEWKSHN